MLNLDFLQKTHFIEYFIIFCNLCSEKNCIFSQIVIKYKKGVLMDIKREMNLTIFTFAVISVVLGVLFVIFNKGFASAVPYIVGTIVIVDGVCALFTYFTRKKFGFSNNFALAQGLIDIVLGILILCSTEFFTTAFGILVGVFLLVWGLFKLNIGINIMKSAKLGIVDISESLLFIVSGILLLVFSKQALEIIVIVLGASMIAIGLFVAIKTFIINKKIYNFKKKVGETFVETTKVVDEPADETIETQVADDKK